MKHTGLRGCICDTCCEERRELSAVRVQQSIETLGDRYALARRDPECDCAERLEVVRRTITGYAERRNG